MMDVIIFPVTQDCQAIESHWSAVIAAGAQRGHDFADANGTLRSHMAAFAASISPARQRRERFICFEVRRDVPLLGSFGQAVPMPPDS